MSARITITDVNDLAGKLHRLSQLRFDAVIEKNMTEIYRRGVNGGTPVLTGELRMSLTQAPPDVVGYRKDYAPHVEYGHRTPGGGYVAGQHFLRNNVEKQRSIFRKDLIKQLERA